MNSVKIGTYQMDTAFGLYLPEYTIPAPAPQTKFVKIIGRDGSVDLSDAIGLHYDSRSWSLDFKCFDPTVNWHTLTSSVMNAIHGKRLNFEFDDDPDYFWTGRISVSSYVSTRGTGTLKVNITSDPFKYAKLSTIVTKTASTGTEYTGSVVTFNDGLIYDLSADIEPIQDLHGYANPWPGGGGVNKFDEAWEIGAISTTTGESVPSNTSIRTANYIPLVGGQSYYWSWQSQQSLYMLLFTYHADKTFSRYVGAVTAQRTLTINSDEAFIRFYIYNDTTEPYWMQISEGSTASPYSPYANICPISGLTGLSVYVSPTQDPDDATVYNVEWSTQAGTVYHGTVDPVAEQLTVDRAYKSFDGSSTTGIGVYNPLSGFWFALPGMSANYSADGLCNMDKTRTAYGTGGVIFGISNNNYAYFTNLQTISGASTVADLCSWLQNNNLVVEFVYPLATPVTYQLSPQDIEALVGTNNIWTSSGDVTVTVVTPETVTNNGLPAIPTVAASADMVLRWGNYSASVQQGTSTIPQLVLETGDNKICIIGSGNISFEWSEASL